LGLPQVPKPKNFRFWGKEPERTKSKDLRELPSQPWGKLKRNFLAREGIGKEMEEKRKEFPFKEALPWFNLGKL